MEKITEDNFRSILESRHPKIFGIVNEKERDELNDKLNCKDQVGEYKNKSYFSISCNKGWFYLLDAIFDLIKDHNIEISDIKEKYGELRIYAMSDDYSEKILQRAESLSHGICEMCGKKIESSKLEKDKYRNDYWIYTRCKSCGVNPTKEYPISKEHMTKEETIKYLTDDNYFYTNVEEFEKMIKNKTYDKKIINLKGKIIREGTDYMFEDKTGSLMVLGKVYYDFLGKIVLLDVYPVFKNGNLYIDFKLAQG